MAISYSGLVNYGKFTLPSVEGWGSNANIVRDPPRSITTRKIERVGDTSKITATLAESDDRFCEAINYYARGVNPMVSVSYGESATTMNSGASNAYMPYRVIRDGAFRPPVWRQEDLFPLSRLPRKRTSCMTTKEWIDYSKRACDCELPTREIREVMKTQCESRKNVSNHPGICEPSKYEIMLKDPLEPCARTNLSCASVDTMERAVSDRPVLDLSGNLPASTNVMSNPNGLSSNAALSDMVPTDIRLMLNRPYGECTTNLCGPVYEQKPLEAYISIPQKLSTYGSFDGRPCIGAVTTGNGYVDLSSTLRSVAVR